MGQHPRILRKRTDRLHAVGAGRWDEGNDQRRLGKSLEGSQRDHLSARLGVVAASVPSNAPDSWDIVSRAPRGKHGGAENTVERTRMEDA